MHFPIRSFMALIVIPFLISFIEVLITKRFGRAGLILPILFILLTPRLGNVSLLLGLILFIIYFFTKSAKVKN